MKKTLHVLFVLIFLLSLGSLSAHAQAGPTSIAYLPLLYPSAQTVSADAAAQNVGAPIPVQARQVFESLESKLMQAQMKGQIVRYQPDFSAGMLMVEYNPGLHLAGLLGARQPVFDTPRAVLQYTHFGQVVKNAQPVPAAAAPYLNLTQNSSCFSGGNLGANNTYKAYLQDTSLRLVALANGSMDATGWVSDCFGGVWSGVVPGFIFTFKVYNSTGSTLLHTYTTGVSRLNITSINPATKILAGTAPASSNLYVWLDHRKLDSSNGWLALDKAVTTSSAGKWQVNFSPDAMRGADEVNVTWSKPSSIFTFQDWLDVPYMECSLGENWCDFSGFPGATLSLFIKHAGKTYPFTAQLRASGWFDEYLLDAKTDPIFLVAGDQAGGTGMTTLTLPGLTAAPNPSTDTITGTATASRWFELALEQYDPILQQWTSYSKMVVSSATGTYSANFSSYVDIKPADTLEIEIWLFSPTTGNETYYDKLIAP